MNNPHNIYLISDSTGETIDRIFTALKSQFSKFNYKIHQYSFTRTKNQIKEIINSARKQKNTIILYTLVDYTLTEYLIKNSEKNKIPCYGVLGDLISKFSKILKTKIFKHSKQTTQAQ